MSGAFPTPTFSPVAPSALKPAGEAMTLSGMKPFVTPRALDPEEIPVLVEQYRTAAKNADMAGFDGVEVHGANGYLLDQFTRDSTNLRDDAYGGPVENRCRFPLEVTDAVVDVWGADRVGYRVSPFQPYNDISDSDPAATFSYLTRELAKRDLVYLHMVEMGGNADGDDFLQARNPLFADLRDIWPNTLMTNGGYDRAKADAVIGAGLADMVSFGAPYLANPDLAERLHSGAAYNEPDRPTFYGGGAKGYTDYPFLVG
jgi:N-ethylmaleimide reductase